MIFDPDDELEGVCVEGSVEVEAVVVLRSVKVGVDGHCRAHDVDAALLEAAQRHQLCVRVFHFCGFDFLKIGKMTNFKLSIFKITWHQTFII